MAKPINVVIKGDYTDRDINRAIRDLERLKTQGAAATGAFGGFANSLKGFGAGLIASIGFSQIVGALTSMGQAAVEDQAKMASLAKTLENVGQGFRSADVEQFIGQMQLASGVADNQLRSSFQRLVTVTGDVTRSQDALKLAMDISAGTGKDLDAVSAALAKAYGGQTTALQRLGVGINAATLKSKDMGAITDALSAKFSGQAAVAAATYQGQMNRLTQAVGEAQEAIGYALLRAMDDMIGKMGGTGGLQRVIIDTGDSIADMIDNISLTVTQVDRLGRSVINLSTAGLVKLDDDVSLVNLAFESLLDALTSLLAGPLTAIVALLEDLGWVTDDAASGASDLAIEHEHMARTAGKAANGIGILTDETEDAADAAFDAAKGYYAFYEASAAAARIQRDLANTSGSVIAGIQQGFSDRFLKGPGKFVNLYGELDRSARSAGGGVDAASKSVSQFQKNTDALAQSLMDLSKDIGQVTTDAGKTTFDKINSQIDAFKSKFSEAKSFAQGIVSTFMSSLDLGAALASAKEAGTSIVEEFVKQGNRAKEFGARMKELLAAGLSKAAMRDIMDLGFDRGLDVMKALQDGNIRQNIDGINEVYKSVEDMANSVADQAKAVFYDAGLNLMLQMLRAMIEELMPEGKSRKRLMALMDSLAASMNRTATITIGVVGPGASYAATPTMVPIPTGLSPSETSDYIDGILMGGAVPFADGGIVTRPTFGVFGEAGPEALIPLDRMGSMGGNTYNINVSTGVGDPRQIGEQVVSYIKRFEAASGPVFARA